MAKLFCGALALVLTVGTIVAQDASAPSAKSYSKIIGNVTAIDGSGKKLTVAPDSGAPADVVLDDSTSYMRVPPGEKDLRKAARIDLKDISVGDRVYARSLKNGDANGAAVSVIVMSKSDLARHQQKSREEWQKRGLTGKIKGIDRATKQITVSAQTPGGAKDIAIQTDDKTGFRRYAADSVKFSDAKPGAYTDLNIGDSVRALGDRSEDGSSFHAEEIVSGSFRNFAGTVVAVNASASEIKLNDLQTKKPVTVQVNADTNLKKFPPNVAAMFARMQNPRAASGGSPVSPAGAPPTPTGGFPAQMGGGPASGMDRAGMARPDMNQMLEHMPAFALADLKPGDALIVSSPNGSDNSRVTAIAVVAGVEPILASAPRGSSSDTLGGQWNFDIGLPQ